MQALTYGRPCAINIDPIEKKPLFHFAPGTQCLSIATVGCNLDCGNCQNWEISHPSGGSSSAGGDGDLTKYDYVEPEAIVEMAQTNGVPGIAYTYTEPTVFFEYAYDTMKLARKAGLYNVWVSNGYTNPEPCRKAAKYMDAINVDLKGDVAFYRSLCGLPAGNLALTESSKREAEAPMHRALKIYKDAGVWIETTTLVIPGKNDKEETISGIVAWVKKNLGAGTPMHFSRFFPHFRMRDVRPTPVETLRMAADLAKKSGMKYIYVGNVSGESENTLCPKCGAAVIERLGCNIRYKRACPKCKAAVPLAGLKWV
jgi:pyruvate formate lyase activating enzyme